MKKENEVAPATDNKAQQTPPTQGVDLQAMSEAIAKQAEVLAQADDKIATLEAENKMLRELNEGLGNTIEELNSALADKDSEISKKADRPILKVGKDSYELRLKKFTFNHKGKPVSVDEEKLKNDPELLAAVVAKNTSALVKKGGK